MRTISLIFLLLVSLSGCKEPKNQSTFTDQDAIITVSGLPDSDIDSLDVILCSSFSDSIIVSAGTDTFLNKFCKTEESLGLSGSCRLINSTNDRLLHILCHGEQLNQSIKLKKGYRCLYIHKNDSLFSFEFTNQIRLFD